MGMNVLIVDDSKETRQEIIQTLRKNKSLKFVFEANNGLEALRLISDAKLDLIITVSTGIATFIPENTHDYEVPLERADEALYKAKSLGRNRIVVA